MSVRTDRVLKQFKFTLIDGFRAFHVSALTVSIFIGFAKRELW
jgi:hypothetical protein